MEAIHSVSNGILENQMTNLTRNGRQLIKRLQEFLLKKSHCLVKRGIFGWKMNMMAKIKEINMKIKQNYKPGEKPIIDVDPKQISLVYHMCNTWRTRKTPYCDYSTPKDAKEDECCRQRRVLMCLEGQAKESNSSGGCLSLLYGPYPQVSDPWQKSRLDEQSMKHLVECLKKKGCPRVPGPVN